jgi:hypothetical protein
MKGRNKERPGSGTHTMQNGNLAFLGSIETSYIEFFLGSKLNLLISTATESDVST